MTKEERKQRRKHKWLHLKNILLGITEKELIAIARQQWNGPEANENIYDNGRN